jgi:hypothetical protein
MATTRIKATTKNLFLAFMVFFANAATLYGIDIVIAPIGYYERSGNNFVLRARESDVAIDLAEHLNRYYSVQFDRTRPSDRLAGFAEIDAKRVAQFYEANYVLFGSIREEGTTLTAEIRLFNERQIEFVSFPASDSVNQYARLIKTIGEHIIEWFHTETDKIGVLDGEIQALREDMSALQSELNSRNNRRQEPEQKEEPLHEFTLRLPVRAGYWTYTETGWIQNVQGTVEATIGVDFTPELQFSAIHGMRNFLSFSLLFGYRYGTTSKLDEVSVHGIIVNPAINYFLNIYTNNWLMAGVGALFEAGIWHIEEVKYEDTRDYQQFLTGLSVSLEYAYRFNQLFSLEIGANMYFYFVENTSPIVKPYLGAIFTVLGGNYEK